MKKRLISMFLVLVMALGLFPISAFAASSTIGGALGEVNITNGGYKMSYLSMNGVVRSLSYTYFNFKSASGAIKEIPAYCINPTTKGVPQSVSPGTSIKYIANEASNDPKIVGIIANGYGNPQNRIHLTEKPLQLMQDIVKITEPGGHILDPFAGSGTTVLAAVLEGYSATGVEVTDAYAKLARERIDAAVGSVA